MNTPNIVWLKNGRILKQVEDTVITIESLDKKIYMMGIDEMTKEIYLEEFADDFHFDFKVYGVESRLINHIMKTYENTSANLGILFNGVKGTGKTITAKILANKMNLPVILINSPYPGLADFIAKINCPCVLFFDEFEKNFNTDKKYDLDLLSVMDGVYNSPYRRVFLLTTNKLCINENLIGRPSRIRYHKSFGNLQVEIIKEYLDDNLLYKEYADDIITFIDSLAISTIDILKSVVEEVNIHGCSVNSFKNFLNVEQAKHSYFIKFHRFDEGEKGSPEAFINLLNKVGTKGKNADGEEYTLDENDLDIYSRRINTPIAIDLMLVGEDLGGYGTITSPINKDGIIMLETEYGEDMAIKVLNLESKPSLYRGGLVY